MYVNEKVVKTEKRKKKAKKGKLYRLSVVRLFLF
jgi:hypothetical protein